MKARSGGGANSRNVVKQGVRTGATASGINHGHAGQIGMALGGNATEQGHLLRGAVEPRSAPGPISVKLGNEVAKNVGAGGPGARRRMMASGSQSMHGRPASGNPPAPGSVFSKWERQL
jgi:hypothetical protein